MITKWGMYTGVFFGSLGYGYHGCRNDGISGGAFALCALLSSFGYPYGLYLRFSAELRSNISFSLSPYRRSQKDHGAFSLCNLCGLPRSQTFG
jgi:hypothetical protein